MSAKSLANLLEGWARSAPDLRITGLALDSRRVMPGDAFVAVRGGREHGARHAAAAVAAGCTAILTDGLAPLGDLPVPVVVLEGLGERLGELGSRFHSAPSEHLEIAGVTGTNGKTSVAHFISQAWERVLGHAGLVGTLGAGPVGALTETRYTTPDALSLQAILAGLVEDGVERVAMEVSSHALAQDRCQTIQFDAAVFTNLSREHLDYHADLSAYAASKLRLFADLAPRFCIVNRDDAVGREWIAGPLAGREVLSYGTGEGAELRGTLEQADAGGMTVAIEGPWGPARVRTGLIGAFNLSNLLATAGTLALLGMRWHEVVHELEMMQPVPGRMMRLGGDPGQPVVIVDYAHTPEALEHALAAVREHIAGRLVCVFGCGGDRDRGKRPEMGRAAEAGADLLVVTSDNPRSEDAGAIIDDVLSGLERPAEARVEPDRAAAIRLAIAQSGPGDVVLVAGKGHERFQEVRGRRIPFSDAEAVREALGEAA